VLNYNHNKNNHTEFEMQGQLLNSDTKERFWSKVDVQEPDNCWNWKEAISNSGYGRIRINYKLYSSHRIAWEAINGPIPKGKMVLHKCDNKLCCNPAHLYCGTQKDNMHDKTVRYNGPYLGGEGRQPKLREDEVRLIRELWGDGRKSIHQADIAKMFKVSPPTISRIVNSASRLCKEGKYA
jgi:hypothetical protein